MVVVDGEEFGYGCGKVGFGLGLEMDGTGMVGVDGYMVGNEVGMWSGWLVEEV